MNFDYVGAEVELLTAGEVRTHLGRDSGDTTSLPTATVDAWILEARHDCYASCGLLPAAQDILVTIDKFPSGARRYMRFAGGHVNTGEAFSVVYRTALDPASDTTWVATEYHLVKVGGLTELWLRDNKNWPSEVLMPAAAVDIAMRVGAPARNVGLLRRAMLLKIGTWAANPAEESEPIVPGAQVQKINESAERIYRTVDMRAVVALDEEVEAVR